MKRINLAYRILCGAVALAVFTATAAFAESVTQVISVTKIAGGLARYSGDNKAWHNLQVGDILKPGTVIQTADTTTVDLQMGAKSEIGYPAPLALSGAFSAKNTTAAGPGAGASGGPQSNLIRVYPSSVLAIDKLSVDRTGVDEVSETQLDLRAGQILGNVKKLSASSRYEVKIPNGVAGIRGTVYMVSATGVVYVLEGQVIISYVSPTTGQLVTATVGAGNSFNPFSGPQGTTAAIPPGVQQNLLNQVNTLTGGQPTPSGPYTKNNTVVNVSSQ